MTGSGGAWIAIIAAGVLGAVASALLTGVLRRLALSAGMIDVPGSRSSHRAPTPRGGGLAIAIVLFSGVAVLFLSGQLATRVALVVGGGAALVAVIGWIEDRYGLAALLRGALYLAVSAAAVAGIGGVRSLDLGYATAEPGVGGSVLAVVGLAWLINLYNFMDGIDALAAVEAVSVSAFAGLLFLLHGQSGPAWICLVMASACIGFLYWNLPPAKMFMGDSGSCMLGFTLGVLAVVGERTGAVPVIAWIILLAVFICDATLTLLRRISAGEKWYSAHRTHAYQLLASSGIGHGRIALWVLGINVFLLGPAALVAVVDRAMLLPAGIIVLIAMGLLWSFIQVRFGATAVLEIRQHDQ